MKWKAALGDYKSTNGIILDIDRRRLLNRVAKLNNEKRREK